MPIPPPTANDGDEACLRRARRGDPEAFAALYRHHARAIHSLAWRLTGDPQAAEDILQDTFLRLLRHIGGPDPKRPLRPWLRTVAANLAIDRLRRGSWEELGALPETVASPAPEPEHYSEASGLLQHLPPLARSLVWLNQVEGWTHRSLGKKFGRSESWSKSIVSRALAQLRGIAHLPEEPSDEA